MRSVRRFCLIVTCASIVSGTAPADIVVSMVGDNDGFSPGNAADTPFRSQNLLDAIDVITTLPLVDLDTPMDNGPVIGFTHGFQLPAGQEIVSARLTVGVHPIGLGRNTDFFGLDVNIDSGINWGSGFGPRAVWTDLLGYIPPLNETTEIDIDLANVPMRPFEGGDLFYMNLLPYLTDGEFNVLAADDSGIDYSVLEIQTIPAPGAVLLGILGLASLRTIRRRWA